MLGAVRGEGKMKCTECIAYFREQPEICTACKKMQKESEWDWEIDTGNRRVRCPECGHALSIGLWCYSMPYRFCAWCGKQMVYGEQISLDI